MPPLECATNLPSRRDPNKNSRTTQQLWDTSRCKRLIRPLTSKLRALRSTTETLPSTTATIQPPKESKPLDPAELPYDPALKNVALKNGVPKLPPRRRVTSDRGLFFGDRRPKIPQRTYSSLSSRSIPSNSASISGPATVPVSVHDQPFPACAVDWDLPLPPEERQRSKKLIRQDEAIRNPQELLDSMKPFLHEYIFAIYSGIYHAFETLLVSTACARKGPPSMKEVAARRIGRAIVATSEEFNNDDAWYDHATSVGIHGEYLREIVRWHGVEILRESILSDFMPIQKNGLGLAGILVGLCRFHMADAEAESLLRSMLEMQPLSANTSDPAFITLSTFWKDSKPATFRILTENLTCDGTPAAFANNSINDLLKTAIEDIETCEMSRKLVSRAFESVFGIWGERHIVTMTKRRKELSRRKGIRKRETKEATPPTTSSPSLPARIGTRAEELALYLTGKLILDSLDLKKVNTLALLEDLARGFLVQDETVRQETEDTWEKWFPIAAKVAILLRCFNTTTIGDTAIVKELVRSSDDIQSESGKDGLKSLGDYVAECYERIYDCSSGKSVTGKNEMGLLVERLLSYSRKLGKGPINDNNPGTPAWTSLETPVRQNLKVILFTPGKQDTNFDQQKERYYISQLALSIAFGFSMLKCAANNHWVQWVANIERKIIGMKIRTPRVATRQTSLNETRKGWRYEEGLGEWVATGATPGGFLSKTKKAKPLAFSHVEISMSRDRKRNWRTEYIDYADEDDEDIEKLTSIASAITDGEDTDMQSEQDDEIVEVVIERRPATPIMSSETADPDTSYSRLFEAGDESSASEAESDKAEDFYAPTPLRAPTSVIRRTPRSKARISKSLLRSVRRRRHEQSSSPFCMSSPLTGTSGSKLGKMFDFSMIDETDDEDDKDSLPIPRYGISSKRIFEETETEMGSDDIMNGPSMMSCLSKIKNKKSTSQQVKKTHVVPSSSPPPSRTLKRKHVEFSTDNDEADSDPSMTLTTLTPSIENTRSSIDSSLDFNDSNSTTKRKIRRFEEILAQEEAEQLQKKRMLEKRKKLVPVAPKNRKLKIFSAAVAAVTPPSSSPKRRRLLGRGILS